LRICRAPSWSDPRSDGLARGELTYRRPGRLGVSPKKLGSPTSAPRRGLFNYHLRREPRYNKGPRGALIRFGRSFTPSGSCAQAPKLSMPSPILCYERYSARLSIMPCRNALPFPGPLRLAKLRQGAVSGSCRTERVKSITALRPTLPPERARQLPRRLQNVFLLTGRCCL
jgi:hypothetical protein